VQGGRWQVAPGTRRPGRCECWAGTTRHSQSRRGCAPARKVGELILSLCMMPIQRKQVHGRTKPVTAGRDAHPLVLGCDERRKPAAFSGGDAPLLGRPRPQGVRATRLLRRVEGLQRVDLPPAALDSPAITAQRTPHRRQQDQRLTTRTLLPTQQQHAWQDKPYDCSHHRLQGRGRPAHVMSSISPTRLPARQRMVRSRVRLTKTQRTRPASPAAEDASPRDRTNRRPVSSPSSCCRMPSIMASVPADRKLAAQYARSWCACSQWCLRLSEVGI
jgi:hypothetical protein